MWFWVDCIFVGVLGLYKSFQTCQIRLPEHPILIQPAVDCSQGFRIELINAVASFAALLHQMCPPKQTKMLGNRRTRYGKRLRDLSGGLAAAAEKIENGAPCWIGQRLKRRLRGMCNRTVPHNA